MANSKHIERMNSEILKVLSGALMKLNDPDFGMLITFVSANTTPNGEFSKIGVSVFEKNAKRKDEIFHKLVKATGFFKKEIANKMKLRIVPEIKFILDGGEEYSKKIEDILKTLNIPSEDDK